MYTICNFDTLFKQLYKINYILYIISKIYNVNIPEKAKCLWLGGLISLTLIIICLYLWTFKTGICLFDFVVCSLVSEVYFYYNNTLFSCGNPMDIAQKLCFDYICIYALSFCRIYFSMLLKWNIYLVKRMREDVQN